MIDDVSLLRWLERADDLPPEQAAERRRILNEIRRLYEANTKRKELHR